MQKIFFYTGLVIVWLLTSFMIATTNYFEFNYPQSLWLMALPPAAILGIIVWIKRKRKA